MVGGEVDTLEEIRATLDCFAANIFYMRGQRRGAHGQAAEQLPQRRLAGGDGRGHGRREESRPGPRVLLDIINASSGVNFATLNRFPKIIPGDYLKGGLTNTLMMKDVDALHRPGRQLGVASLNASGPLASFGLAKALGYADEISNTVVDAIGDVSGGVRLHTGDRPPPRPAHSTAPEEDPA